MDPFSSEPFGDTGGAKNLRVGARTVSIQKRLAEGGFGSVDLVRDASSGESIVMKTMMVMGEENTEQLMKEVKVMRSMGAHPHIVRLLEAQSTRIASDRIKVEMLLENCPAGTLLDRLNRRSSSLPLGQALGCFGQIVSAVAHMHSQRPPIAHRDLKLENVLIGADGKLRLCDFGSVSDRQGAIKDKRDRTDEQDRIERFTTPHFRAPEMVDLYSGNPIDERVDVWALGCLWHAILYLSHPFQTTGVLAIVSATYTLPEEAKGTPPTCIELLRACLRVDPRERPTCKAILAYVAAASRAVKAGGEEALRGAGTAGRLRALLVNKEGKQCPTTKPEEGKGAGKGGGGHRARASKQTKPSATDAVLSLAMQGGAAGGGGGGGSRRTRGGRKIGGGGGSSAAGGSRGSRKAASSQVTAGGPASGDDAGDGWSPFGGNDGGQSGEVGLSEDDPPTAAAGGDGGDDFDPFGEAGADGGGGSGGGDGGGGGGGGGGGDDFDPFGAGGGEGSGGGGGPGAPSDDEGASGEEDDLFGGDAPTAGSDPDPFGGGAAAGQAKGAAGEEDDEDLFGGGASTEMSTAAAVAGSGSAPGWSSAASSGGQSHGVAGGGVSAMTPRSYGGASGGPVPGIPGGPGHGYHPSVASAGSAGGVMRPFPGTVPTQRFASTGMGVPGVPAGAMSMGAGMSMGGAGYSGGQQPQAGYYASGQGYPGAGGHFASHSGVPQAMPRGGAPPSMGFHGRSMSHEQPSSAASQALSRDDVSKMLAERSGAAPGRAFPPRG